MRILVSEFVCGGAWTAGEIPLSLAAEGRAMIEAVVDDLSKRPHVSVLTTWDERLESPRFLEDNSTQVHFVSSAEDEMNRLDLLASRVDAALIIAPEFNGILEKRCRFFEVREVQRLNCSTESIRLCSDKLQIFELCRQHGIPTIETISGQTAFANDSLQWSPAVVKLRDGAGSTNMLLVSSDDEWSRCRTLVESDGMIVQPWIHGHPFSVAAVCAHGTLQWIMPPVDQLLSSDGTFRYLGGCVPAEEVCSEAYQNAIRIIAQFVQRVPGLHGIIGFDFLLSAQSSEVLLVEVNPRLTTSYVGYRQLASENLSAWIVNPAYEPLPAFANAQKIRFAANGQLVETVT